MKTRAIATLLGIGALAGLITASSPALANIKQNCTVTQVAFDQHIFAQCSDGTTFLGYLTTENASCGTPTNVTIETLKIWDSMFMSALLAGRPVDIYFNPVSGTCNANGIFNLAVK